MLLMKCPECKEYIKSVLLAELKEVECEHCHATVPVANVLVSSNGFTFERNDLLRRFFRYRKLLDEAIEERNSLKGNSASSEASQRSIEKFLQVLQGMMAGARDHFRYTFPEPILARLGYSQQECPGAVYNVSMDGVCVEVAKTYPLPRVKTSMTLSFKLPGQQQLIKITGEICWARQGGTPNDNREHTAGVHFRQLDETTRDILWQFILDKSRDLPVEP